MGEAKSRISRFRGNHPNCCFCGGFVQTESVDHLPPKVMFLGSEIPKKYSIEFPACVDCNHGSKQFDQAAAMVALTFTEGLTHDSERHFLKVLNGVKNNANSIVYEIKDGLIGNRQLEKEFYQQKGQKVAVCRIGENTLLALRVLTAKMGLGYYYQATGSIVSDKGAVVVSFITNADIDKADVLEGLDWNSPFFDMSCLLAVKNQFLIRHQLLDDNSGGIFQFGFHRNLLCVAIVVTDVSNHPVDLNSDMTFRPGFISKLSQPKNEFRTSFQFAV